MSRAGKFIPGGAGANRGAQDAPGSGRTGPIRAPAPGAPAPDPSAPKKTNRPGASLVRPVAKNQRLPIMLMSAAVVSLILGVALYYFAVLPAKLEVQKMRAQLEQAQAAQKKAVDDLQHQKDQVTTTQSLLRATLTVDSRPSAASVTIGDEHKPTPASFTDLIPGTVTVTIHADGFQDFKQEVTVNSDKPTDLGTIDLTQKTGSLSLSSPQTEVEYILTGPDDYSHQGKMPDKLDKLAVGDYQLTAWQHDWKLPPVTVTIHYEEDVQKETKFPYATAVINSTPPGATVRQGHTVLGLTPLTLGQLRPTDLHLSIDLAPYTTQRFVVFVPEFGTVTKDLTLKQDRDFIAACGMPMVWVPEGAFWAGKYHVRQKDFETVAGYNPSFFRRPNRPVEQISWDGAMAFCDKLNDYERKAGKLPARFHYSLPTESQWAMSSADADIDQSPMSRVGSLNSTQDAGASEPNKYGIFDTLGNVWEWCLDNYDEKGNHSLRGGSWLSSTENFPNVETRNAGPPKYSDRFTGFRVVLVPDSGGKD